VTWFLIAPPAGGLVRRDPRVACLAACREGCSAEPVTRRPAAAGLVASVQAFRPHVNVRTPHSIIQVAIAAAATRHPISMTVKSSSVRRQEAGHCHLWRPRAGIKDATPKQHKDLQAGLRASLEGHSGGKFNE
jgi:hypothetical protein